MESNVSLLAIHNQPQLATNASKITNMSIGDNIRALRKDHGWTQEELAKRVNISRGRIAQIEKDPSTDVRSDTLLNLAKALGCSADNLRYGWGNSSLPEIQPTFCNIPVLDVELSAGMGAHIDLEHIEDRVPIDQEWIFRQGLNERTLAIVNVRGDSMTPTLNDGDTILIDTADTRPQSGKIYALAFDEELKVKRLNKQIDSSWRISSDNKSNPAYQDETVSHHNISQLRVLGRVVSLLMRTF